MDRDRLTRRAALEVHDKSGCSCGLEDNPPAELALQAGIVLDVVEPEIRKDERAKIAAWLRGHLDNDVPVKPSVILRIAANTLENVEEWPE